MTTTQNPKTAHYATGGGTPAKSARQTTAERYAAAGAGSLDPAPRVTTPQRPVSVKTARRVRRPGVNTCKSDTGDCWSFGVRGCSACGS
jgi:hypothetical protein